MQLKQQKNICYAKGEDAFDHSTVIWGFMKSHPGYKNLDNKAKSGRPKNINSQAVFQAINANLTSYTR